MSKNLGIQIVCGITTHAIYAKHKHDTDAQVVTAEAIQAVRDYFVDAIARSDKAEVRNTHSIGQQWTRKDGSVVKLFCTIEGGKDDEED